MRVTKRNKQDGTPGSATGSHAPTPLSGAFKDNSGAGTPTGSAAGKKGGKKKEVDDSEAEVQSQGGTSKKRTNFGASRK